MVTDTVLDIRGLVSGYAGRTVLNGVDLQVTQGQIFVIMGASGCGKSTLLRHVLGLRRPQAGSVRLLGEDVTRLDRTGLYALRRKVGVAFQQGALFSSMTLAQNVSLPLHEHTGLEKSTIDIMMRMKLELMNLGGFEHLRPSELSGGMRKRAGLARAVVMDPHILFFDEPSAGLDPVSAAELDELILKLRHALNMTIVVITHELQSALKIADRIAVLGDGRVLIDGTVAQVRASRDPRVRNLIERRPRDEDVDPDAYLGRLTGGI
ncbi:MAG: ABC transporter ATP-binding protein [Gammaproteobacteria bacterium]|nr:ABC transporter ATP-binding protein [Gammaproteobacteria bacterium]